MCYNYITTSGLLFWKVLLVMFTLLKGDEDMGNTVVKYNTLDLCTLMGKKSKIVSSEEALKNVKPIEWSDDVIQGKKKVLVTKSTRG